MRSSLNSDHVRMRNPGTYLAQLNVEAGVSATRVDNARTIRFQCINDTLGEAKYAFCHDPIFLDGIRAHSRQPNVCKPFASKPKHIRAQALRWKSETCLFHIVLLYYAHAALACYAAASKP